MDTILDDPIEVDVEKVPESFMEAIDAGKTEIMEQILSLTDPLRVVTRNPLSEHKNSDGYSALLHANLCKFKLLGMNNKSAAAAAGIGVRKFRNMCENHPQLADDLEQASQLVVSEVAKMLFEFMQKKDNTGFQAVKFFLSTHSADFQEETTINVQSPKSDDEIADAIRTVYGIEIDNNKKLPSRPGPDANEAETETGAESICDSEPNYIIADLPA